MIDATVFITVIRILEFFKANKGSYFKYFALHVIGCWYQDIDMIRWKGHKKGWER